VSLGSSGVWEIFIPGVAQGQRYKFEIRTPQGGLLVKADPYGFAFEVPPLSASIVYADDYQWGDHEWMSRRPELDSWFRRPMSVYEVHLGSWMRVPEEGDRYLSYRELSRASHPLRPKEMGYTHIELLPVMEHPFSGSWGYQVTGFFAPTSRFGAPHEFKAFVDACHRQGIGVAARLGARATFRRTRSRWRSSTARLCTSTPTRGRGSTATGARSSSTTAATRFATSCSSNAMFWLREYHIDGLRVDAVASMLYLDYSREGGEWVPNRFGGRENLEAIDFMRQLNTLSHAEEPGSITIAEESTSWPSVSRPAYLGGLGFTYKWNMGWMNDILEYVKQDPVHRRYHHRHLTFALLYAFSENFILPFSHDEVVHGKGSMFGKIPGDDWQKAATLRALYGFMYAHPGKKLMFMGGEFGQGREWNYDTSLDWHLLDEPLHGAAAVRQGSEPALYAGTGAARGGLRPGRVPVDRRQRQREQRRLVRPALARTASSRSSRSSTSRRCRGDGYRIGVPHAGAYTELLNSDSEIYGGSNLGNGGGVFTEPIVAHGTSSRCA
jgi:1,4-alpha-glucan branching enzyme